MIEIAVYRSRDFEEVEHLWVKKKQSRYELRKILNLSFTDKWLYYEVPLLLRKTFN